MANFARSRRELWQPLPPATLEEVGLGATPFYTVDLPYLWGRATRAGRLVIGAGLVARIVHDGGIMTTYSHMSAMVAQPGTLIRQGQVIGYVGSSGLSTGPHMHFEVRVNGRPINPLTARLVSRPVFDGAQLAAFKARLKQVTSIPMTLKSPPKVPVAG